MADEWPMALAVVTGAVLLALCVRLLLRIWNSRLITQANRKLQLPIPAFTLLNRRLIIKRLLKDKELQQLIVQQSAKTGMTAKAAQKQCERYAQEMLPNFKASFYFRIGYWLARSLLLSHYHAHSRLPQGRVMEGVDANASVVLVMNHRSNMDVLLINFLASRRSTVMHAAGEWARLWPLHHLVRMAGNYVVDRDAKDPVYHALLKAYVQMAAAEGANLAIFPEGELSQDGKLQTPKFGLLSYVATAPRSADHGDIYFIPVGINYDYIPEESTLAFNTQTAYRTRGKLHLFLASVFATGRMAYRVLRPTQAQFGNACASFGPPLSLRDWQAEHGVDPTSQTTQRQWVTQLGDALMAEIAEQVPVLPTHILATHFASSPDKSWRLNELHASVTKTFGELRSSGATLCLPGEDERTDTADALRMLIRRNLVFVDAGQHYRANPSQLPNLQYLGNSISHLISGVSPSNRKFNQEEILEPYT